MYEVVQETTPFGKTDDVLKIENTSSSKISYTFGNILEIDDVYTFSCWMKSDVNSSTDVCISDEFGSFDLTTNWQRIIFTATSNISTSKSVEFTIPTGVTIYAYEGQLEIGNKASDFSANPNDIVDVVNDIDNKVVVLQTNFTVQQGQIEQLIKETTIDGKSLSDKFTEITTTVDGTKTDISNIKTDIDGMSSKMTSIEETVNGVKTTVTSNQAKWDSAASVAETAQTIANQTADKFTWIVKSGTSSTNFVLTDRTAQLVAENINLNGLVKFSGLDSSTQEKINVPNNTIEKWNEDDIDEDVTIINGGYIKTGTIDSNRLNVEDIFSSGSAVMNIINAQEINADRITSGKISSKYIDAYGLSILDKDSNIETFSISSDGQVMLRGSVESYDYVSGKSGWSINRSGSAEFNDVTVRGSVITGDGGIASSGGLGTNLQKNSSFYDGLNDWTYTRGVWQVDTSFKYKGTNTVSFVRQGLVSENATNLRSLNNAIPATSGETFTAQASFYSTDYGVQFNKENVKLRIIFFNSSGTSLGDAYKEVEFVNGSWVTVEVTGTAPANTSYVTLCITNTLNGVYWLGQPKLERGSIATAWSLSPNDKGQTPRFWAGTTYENREYAPFIVYNDGSLKATRGTFGGVFTGDIQIGNVSIVDPSSSSGNDATITVLNGSSGIRAIQLTDTSQSTFAQNLIVSDNYYNEQIRLSQNGSINASNQIVIGNINDTTSDRAILADTYLQFGGGTISSSDKKITINRADDLEVGSITNATDLTIYGNANIKNVLKVFKEINFNDVVKCTISGNGLDFNFYDGSNDTTYRVRWDTQGGSTIADSYVIQNKTVAKPTNPTYSDGATFLGWYKDKTYTQEWSFDYPVNNNMTLYAKWAEPTQPKLSEANCLKTNTCIAYRTLDGVDTVGNGWKIIFDSTSFSGKVVSYDWYADLYEIADNGDYKISKADVINGQTKNTISGADLVKITGYEKNYELKGRCSVVVKLGNTTKTYTYDGFRSICELK